VTAVSYGAQRRVGAESGSERDFRQQSIAVATLATTLGAAIPPR